MPQAKERSFREQRRDPKALVTGCESILRLQAALREEEEVASERRAAPKTHNGLAGRHGVMCQALGKSMYFQ